MSVPLTDADLVQQALGGSQAAYHALVARYATPAVNLATRMVQDRALAEDLAQEAFVRAFERLATYDQKRRFASWFFQILHNVTIDHLRHKRPGYRFARWVGEGWSPRVPATASGGAPDALAEQAALVRAVDAALSRIRPEYREAVVLRYREDLSVQEIADTMRMPVGTVKIYLYRARKELASILSEQGWHKAPNRGG